VITRKTERGEVYHQNEAISRKEALQMYTVNNARASFDEDKKGSIEAGKLADLVVISDDILTCPVAAIQEIKSVLTMVNGQIVYENGFFN
jgi:predicted amidohydrolase YtcJ